MTEERVGGAPIHATPPPFPEGERPAIPPRSGNTFVIAAGHELAAQAGAEIYEKTGNVADAAVAATLALGVLEPHLFGLGGEVSGIVHVRGRTRVLAGATRAPRAMTIEAFRRARLDAIPAEGLMVAGPPAVMHALVVMLRDLGTAPFSVVAAPAIRLAADGFAVDRILAFVIAASARKFREDWPSSGDVWLTDGKPPRFGDVVRQPALARTLQRLADAGDHEAVLEEMRTGFVAQAILDFAAESFLAAGDLATFRVVWEDPVTWTDRHGRTICKAGPWTQGPALLQQLGIMEAGGWDTLPPLGDDLLHATVESIKLAMADREAFYGDPDFVDVPLDELLSTRHAIELAGKVDMTHAQSLGAEFRTGRHADGDTTHLDVVDGEMAVSFTPSGGWFSSPVVPELGLPLGTRCQTFYLDEEHPNALVPGKRPRTTLTPTIVLKDGRPLYALGTPGGDAQDQQQGQMLHALAHGWAPQDVVDMPVVGSEHAPSSFHPHSARPMHVDAETRIDADVLQALRDRGHVVNETGEWRQGRPHVVEVRSDGSMRGAVSRRLWTGGVVAY